MVSLKRTRLLILMITSIHVVSLGRYIACQQTLRHSSYFLFSYFLPATKSPQTRLPWKVLRPYRFRKIYLKPIQKKNLREGLVFFTDVSSSKPICKLLRNLTNKLIIAQNIHTVCRCRHFSYCLDSWNTYSV